MDAIEQKKTDTYNVLIQFITEIIGEDVVEELDITTDSTFTRDLEMDSIEIVAFAEKVKKEYGDEIDFAGWLSVMDLEQLTALSIGDIVDFIVTNRK